MKMNTWARNAGKIRRAYLKHNPEMAMLAFEKLVDAGYSDSRIELFIISEPEIIESMSLESKEYEIKVMKGLENILNEKRPDSYLFKYIDNICTELENSMN